MLAEALAARGMAVLRTREPGGAKGAEFLRGVLLHGGIDWSAPAETLLHFAARAEHVERGIRPALNAGMWVICDRFADSTLAYQGYGQGADRAMIAVLSGLLGITPDLTLVLEASEPVAAERLKLRALAADRYEQLDGGFHRRVNDGFRAIAAANPGRCVTIDADGGLQAVHDHILRAVTERLGLPA